MTAAVRNRAVYGHGALAERWLVPGCDRPLQKQVLPTSCCTFAWKGLRRGGVRLCCISGRGQNSDTQVSVNAGLHSEASLLDAAKRSLSVTASPYCAHLWVSHSSGRHVGLDV